jgi:hypothetical protein
LFIIPIGKKNLTVFSPPKTSYVNTEQFILKVRERLEKELSLKH